MRDEDEVHAFGHLLDDVAEPADVVLVERRVHFVEDAEGARLILEDPDQQGLAYYNTLKAKGVDSRLVFFPAVFSSAVFSLAAFMGVSTLGAITPTNLVR